MKKRIFASIIFVVLLSSAGSGFTISVSPSIISTGYLERGHTYEYESYITNPDTAPITLTLDITPRSQYLKNVVTIIPETLTIGPGKKEQVKIKLSIPNESTALANGTHTLTILPYTPQTDTLGVKTVSTSVIEIRFKIPGYVKEELILETFSIQDAGEEIVFNLLSKNTGNVRISAFPFVEIQRHGSRIDTARGNTQYLVNAGDSARMDVKYSTAGLEPGNYKAVAYIEYSTGKKTESLTETFKIKSDEQVNEDANKDTVTDLTAKTKDISEEKIPQETENLISPGNDPETRRIEGEIQIRNLSAKANGTTLQIALEIENTATTGFDYELSLNIFDESGKKKGTIIGTGRIDGSEAVEIKKSFETPSSGNYRIVAEITYSKDDGITEKVKDEIWIEIKKDQNRVTGLFLQSPNAAGIITASLATLVILMMTSRSMRRKIGKKRGDREHSLDSVSKRYENMESNLEKISKETKKLKNRFEQLKNLKKGNKNESNVSL